MTIKIKYFASLREVTKKEEEILSFENLSALELFQGLHKKYHFPLTEEFIKVAINETYQEWNTPLKKGDTVAFIPPVAGG